MLAVRGTDTGGAVQPDTAPWNLLGMGNNLQRGVAVTVTADGSRA